MKLWSRCIVLVGAVAAAIADACSNSTSPHQPAVCPSYSGGAAQPDTLYGLYHLVSYCLDTLPAFGPPTDSGHVTLSHSSSVDSFVAVLATQGQQPETILGTYTHPIPDSIHVTGEVRAPGVPFAVPVQLLGRFLLRHDSLSVSGSLVVTGTSPHFVSFIGAR
ncbi:MAG TPA: hypothetical protein VM716_13210 [Gemmatimonadales bacterium]|nr:hypothetical protein [Gemmatimonadales bacterium]